MFIVEIKFVEGKENSKKYTEELEADLEKKCREIKMLKEKLTQQERICLDLQEKCRVQAEEKEKLDIKLLKTERQNISLLCEIKSIRKRSSDREKEIASDRENFEISLKKKSEEIEEIKKKYLALKKQKLSETKTLLEIFRYYFCN